MKRLKAPSPALVISIIALVMAMAGTGYAAFKVGTKNIKNGAVTTKKLHNGAVTTKKLKNGAVTQSKLGSGLSVANATNATNANHANTVAAPESVHRIGATGEPAFQNGCTNHGGDFETAGFYKDGFGIVHLVGDISTCTASATVFTLPAGYRPSTRTRFVVKGNTDTTTGVVRVDTNGDVVTFGTTTPVLNGLTFRP